MKLTRALGAAVAALALSPSLALAQAGPAPQYRGPAGTFYAPSAVWSVGQVSLTDFSGAIAAGGASQQAVPQQLGRRYLLCQNPSAAASGVATESVFVNFGAAASASGGSVELPNGSTVVFETNAIPTDQVNVTAPTTGHKFTCKAAL